MNFSTKNIFKRLFMMADEGGGYLGAMTYQCLYNASFERLKRIYIDNSEAVDALNVRHFAAN